MRIIDYIRKLFFAKSSGLIPAHRPDPANAIAVKAVWLGTEDNAFGVQILDCTAFIADVTAWSSDPTVAQQFASSRMRDGSEYIAQSPENALSLQSNLSFPYNGKHEDGPVFLAQVMEEKWDMFLHGNKLYIAKSWTGKLTIVATCQFFLDRVEVTGIEVDQQMVDGQDDYPEQMLDFLVKSHMSRWIVAHPLRKLWKGQSAEELASKSFSSFGRLGLFGTFENTIKLPRMLRKK